MTMTCRTCRSEMREDVDIALINGEPLRNIAERADLSLTSVFRHKESHLPGTLVDSREALERARGDVLIATAAGLLDKPWASYNRLKAQGT
jgi:hypothetical protein